MDNGNDKKLLSEGALRRRAVFEKSAIGIALISGEGHVLEGNPSLQRMLGYSAEALRSSAFLRFSHPDDAAADEALFRELIERRRSDYRIERRFLRRDGSVFWGSLTVSLGEEEEGEPPFAVVFLEEITERKTAEEAHARRDDAERQRYLEAEKERRRYLDLLEGMNHGFVWIADAANFRFSFVGTRAVILLGYPINQWREEANFWANHLHPDDRDRVMGLFQLVLASGADQGFEHRIQKADGRYVWVHTGVRLARDVEGAIPEFRGLTVDITRMKEVEDSLRGHVRQQAAVTEIGRQALAGADLCDLMQQVVASVSEVLDAEYSAVWELLSDGEAFLLRAGAGWRPGLVGEVTVAAGHGSPPGETLLSGEPVIIDDLRSERRFQIPSLLQDHGVVSGMSVLIQDREHLFGALSIHTARPRKFTRDDVYFLQAVANVLMTAIERKRSEAALNQKSVEAEEASRLKSQFISTVSHELRTPLNAIIGYSSLLKEKGQKRDAAKREEMLDRIHYNAEVLIDLINSILDLSKIEARQMAIQEQELSLSEWVGKVMENLKPQGESKGLRFDLIDDPTIPAIRSDPGKIRQILANLIGNAIKFTEKGMITARLRHRPEEERVSVEIQDTGIGIEEKDLAQIFQPFYQAGFSDTREYAGTGLGLAIAKELAVLLGGRIEAVSTPGEGSTFTLHLPYRLPAKNQSARKVA